MKEGQGENQQNRRCIIGNQLECMDLICTIIRINCKSFKKNFIPLDTCDTHKNS